MSGMMAYKLPVLVGLLASKDDITVSYRQPRIRFVSSMVYTDIQHEGHLAKLF